MDARSGVSERNSFGGEETGRETVDEERRVLQK